MAYNLDAKHLGQKVSGSSVSTVPASDITDPTYIGDINFGEQLPAGTNLIGIVRLGTNNDPTYIGDTKNLLVDETGSRIEQKGDKKIKAGVGIDVLHHKIHEGLDYGAGHIFESVADDGTSDILVKVSADNDLHSITNFAVGGDAFAYLYEDVVPTTNGTEITPSNLNRESTKVTTGSVYFGPTVAAGSLGIELPPTFIPGGQKKDATGGENGGRHEWILDKSTNYLFRLVNKANATAHQSININYYEHD